MYPVFFVNKRGRITTYTVPEAACKFNTNGMWACARMIFEWQQENN